MPVWFLGLMAIVFIAFVIDAVVKASRIFFKPSDLISFGRESISAEPLRVVHRWEEEIAGQIKFPSDAKSARGMRALQNSRCTIIYQEEISRDKDHVIA